MSRFDRRGGGSSRRSSGGGRGSSRGASSRRGGGGGGASSSKKKGNYKKVGGVWEHPEYGESITVDDYYGDLIFVARDKEGNVEGEFKVKRIYVQNPPYKEVTTKSGNQLIADLKLDLLNDNCVDLLDD